MIDRPAKDEEAPIAENGAVYDEPPASADRSHDQRTVGPRQGLGAGIISLGVFAIVMPLAIDQMPSVADGGSAAFVVSGMTVLIGIFVIIAGVMSFVVKD
jgi:hypothetical protein